MPAFPTITNGFTINTGTSGVTYPQIVNSLLSTQYRVKQIYIYASSLSQLSNTFTFMKQNPDGTASSIPDSVLPNPNQIQNSYYWDFGDGEFILDNNTMLNFQLNPNASMQLIYYTDYHTPQSGLLQ